VFSFACHTNLSPDYIVIIRLGAHLDVDCTFCHGFLIHFCTRIEALAPPERHHCGDSIISSLVISRLCSCLDLAHSSGTSLHYYPLCLSSYNVSLSLRSNFLALISLCINGVVSCMSQWLPRSWLYCSTFAYSV